ncbi:MAG: glycosyl transferase group 1 family protein, partial [Herbinix sp.]|nr:glycosyl transferase group 1 family protein [Herbinix sp.]
MSEPIRVLQIVPNMQAGGLETLIMNIYRNIDRSKVQFDFLVHYTSRYFYDDEIEKFGGKIYRLSFREDNNFIKYIKDLNYFFSTHKYEIVHCHMASTAIFTLGVAKKYGVSNRILHSHNSSTDSTIKGKAKGVLLKVSKSYANKYFACGVAAGKFLYGIKQFEVIHNAIDVEKFAYAQRKDDPILNALEDKFVIGHVGRFTEQKNHIFLIDIFKDYHAQNSNSVLLLIGEGELRNEIEDKVNKLGLKDSVVFYGTSIDMQSIYKCFDVFLLPSLFEGLPVVGIESQAAGIECLYSDKITKEVEMTDLIKFLPIDSGTEPWVNALDKINNENMDSYHNVDIAYAIENAGYEIKTEAKRVQNIYENFAHVDFVEKCNRRGNDLMKAWIILNSKSIGDIAVTSFYLETIKKSFLKSGYECKIWNSIELLDKEKDIFIFDECKVAVKYIFLGYKKIVIWTQGIVPEEAVIQGYSRLRYYVHSVIEKIVLSKSSFVFLCSDYMKEHYKRKYKICLNNYVIMPCFNESEVDEEALNEKKYEKNSFLYVGSLKAWQCFDETLDLYKEIEKKSQKESFLYVFTGEQQEAIEKIKKRKIENFKVDYSSQEELGIRLRNMKYGFVIREDSEFNRVATPTKFSNYISHGIIPIYSSCLKSFHNYNTESNGPGIVCDI